MNAMAYSSDICKEVAALGTVPEWGLSLFHCERLLPSTARMRCAFNRDSPHSGTVPGLGLRQERNITRYAA
jgi:hypothetical protein